MEVHLSCAFVSAQPSATLDSTISDGDFVFLTIHARSAKPGAEHSAP